MAHDTNADPPTSRSSSPSSPEDWELVRRSVAMLPPGAWAMRREQSLQALSALIKSLRRG